MKASQTTPNNEESKYAIDNGVTDRTSYQQLARDSRYSTGGPNDNNNNNDSDSDDNDKPPSKPHQAIIQFDDGQNEIIRYWKYDSKKKMKLDYGFRSIYLMYRFNHVPIIYVIISIASIYLPSYFFPKDNGDPLLLCYIHLSFAILNGLIIIGCLIKALYEFIKGDSKENENTEDMIERKRFHSALSLPFNPTDDPDDFNDIEESDIESDSEADKLIQNENGDEEIVKANSKTFSETRSRKISVNFEGLEKRRTVRFFYKFCEQFNSLFRINEVKSRIASKIAPTFAAFLIVYSVVCCHVLLAAVTYIFKVCCAFLVFCAFCCVLFVTLL